MKTEQRMTGLIGLRDEITCFGNFKFLVFIVFFICGKTYSQKTSFEISLIDKKEFTPVFDKVFDMNKDYIPYVQVFLPEKEKATGRAVLVCPGGGYGMVAFGHEGTRWAEYFVPKGIAIIVLRYRLPKGDKRIPMGDAETALGIIKEHATEWNIDINQVGIMGSSAGGHLASTIATHELKTFVPAFQILFLSGYYYG